MVLSPLALPPLPRALSLFDWARAESNRRLSDISRVLSTLELPASRAQTGPSWSRTRFFRASTGRYHPTSSRSFERAHDLTVSAHQQRPGIVRDTWPFEALHT